jgi:HSP20 family protein
MDLVRWRRSYPNPARELNRLQREINDLFSFSPFPDSRGVFDRSISPALDVLESDDEFSIRCDLPGMKQEEIEISVASGVLTIKGEKKAEEHAEKTRVYRTETWEGSFQRTVSLPAEADSEKIEATLRDGVLTVTVPKRDEAKPKQITLKAV